MSIPTRLEAAATLARVVTKPRLINHLSSSAEVASFMCAAMRGRGVELDSDLAESAALLHDIDKALAPDDPYRALGHGAAGAQWLIDQGFAELADAVREHPVHVIGNAASYEEWLAANSLEARIANYADKRSHEDIVSLDERFERWYRRFGDDPMLPIAQERFRRLEGELCALAGVAPDEVERLPWVEAALRKARAA
jgi:putative nucleotidyltransferase with HDIG domain